MDVPYDIGMIRRSCVEDAMPPGLVEVFNEFHRQHVSYCYWKSSRRIHEVLAGAGDVDLLVARADQHRVQVILAERDFKLFPSVADRDHPATLSFLGYDERSGQLIHLHLHFRLIVGERLLKNYRIPWEEVLLTRAILHPTLPVRILEPTSEAVLLVVRACLELRRVDLMTLCVWQATTRSTRGTPRPHRGARPCGRAIECGLGGTRCRCPVQRAAAGNLGGAPPAHAKAFCGVS